MPWPSLSDYTQAVGGFPHISILDLTLKGGNPRRGSSNDLISYSGGFSIVFPIKVLTNTYALRCWIRDIGDAETRYQKISDYLRQCGLSYFVDFEYVPEGILVNGIKYSITRMEWAEGETLCDFIKHNLQDARCLKSAAAEFQKMVEILHAHQISHGDLQDGNILLKRNGTDVKIKLIDYDSLFVPALRGQPDNIVGFQEYQHPQRMIGGGQASEKVDYFSELVIYLSLQSLAEKPDLWSQFGDRTEKGLLFIAEDFKHPDQSDVFRELENLSPDVKHLASKLKEFCKRSIDRLEPLEAILPKTSPAQVVYNQGLAYLHSNRYNEAVVEFEKAIGLDPNYKEAYHGLGLAHLKMGNLGEAKRKAERALGIDPYYQPAHQLLDAVKSFRPPPTPPPPPDPLKPTFLESVLDFWQYIAPNLWQYITSALAFILMICIVVLATQISAKDEALRRIEMLVSQQVKTDSNLNAATSSIQALSNEKVQLLRENQRLQNQLTEQDEETKTQIATVRQLRGEKEELRSQNRKLRNQLTEQETATKTQIAVDRREKEELHSQNQELQNEKEELLSQKRKLQNENAMLWEQLDEQKPPRHPPDKDRFREESLQKIYHNSIPRVRSAAISKNNIGYDAFNKNQYSKAIEFFDDAIKSDSQSEIVHYNLGSTYLAIREYAKSVNYLQKAVTLDPKFKEAHYNLALAYLRWGYRQEGKKAAQAALNIDKNYRPARQLLDYLDRLMGDE